jgi:predicted ATPase/class 3 adenylate cyclase
MSVDAPNNPGSIAPTGLVTLVFTDLQGSTELWEKLQSRFAEALTAHNSVMRGLIAKHSGYEVKTEGDAFMIAFSSPTMAVRFALELQEQMATAMPDDIRRDTGAELLVRMGIHMGEPICERDPTNGRMDYFGPMVNRSARISAAGHGGQILLSHAVREAAGEELESALVKDLGEHRLKSLSRAERLYQVLPYSLASRTYSPLKTLDHVATNLPYQQTTFVGRRAEWTELTAAFKADKWNLVTLTGPGGTGKTRLSLRVGNELLDHYEGGVWFADLSECTTTDAVCAQVAGAFGVPLVGPEPPEKVIAAVLEYRKPLLLILDNFEQLVELCAPMVGMWMKRARATRFLVTSRTLLGLAGEHEYRLEPMRTPPRVKRKHGPSAGEGLDAGTAGGFVAVGDTEEEEAAAERAREDALLADQHAVRLSQFDVVRLFVERAREASPGFTLTDDNAPDIADICIELEGAPLAIELAAARVKILRPAQIVQKLSRKFELLRSSRRDLPRRQQTLEGAIDWSWDLLKDHEKTALCQVCVFRGGFFLEQGEEVLDLSEHPDAPLAMDVIQALREQSLLSSVDTPGGMRLRMFQSIRAYAEGKSAMVMTPVQAREIEMRHARCYAALAEHWDTRRGGREAAEAFDYLELECENIFVAQDRAAALGEAALAGRCVLAAAVTMAVRGLSAERVPRLRSALAGVEAALVEKPSDKVLAALRSRLMIALCQACQDTGKWDEAQGLAERALALAEEASGGNVQHLGAALVQIGEMHRLRGRFESALASFDRAAEVFRGARASAGEARALGGRGSVLWQQEKFDEAIDCFTRASAMFERLGNKGGVARNIGGQGLALTSRGDAASALACYDRAEAVYRGTRNKSALARTLGNRALALEKAGDLAGALKCLADAESLNREIGGRASVARNVGNRGELLLASDPAAALACFDEAAAIHTELGNRQGVALAADRRGRALLALGRGAEAKSSFQRSIEEYSAIGLGHTTHARAAAEGLKRAEDG